MGLAKNPYSKEIFERTKLSEERNLVLVPCSCKKGVPFHKGSPEHYSNFKKAAFRFHFHKVMQTKFWGVHYRGKHIADIKDSE